MTTRKTPVKSGEKKQRKREDELLDEELDKTFPASDPPSILQPHRRPDGNGGGAD